MIKSISFKEINLALEENGYSRITSYRDLRRSLGVRYIEPKRAFSKTPRVILKRINAAIYGG